MSVPSIDLEQLVPSGIQEVDTASFVVHEEKCSRCKRDIADDEVPLMLFSQPDADVMWIYCESCVQPALAGAP